MLCRNQKIEASGKHREALMEGKDLNSVREAGQLHNESFVSSSILALVLGYFSVLRIYPTFPFIRTYKTPLSSKEGEMECSVLKGVLKLSGFFVSAPSPVLNLVIENRTVDSLEIGWKSPGDLHAGTYRYSVCLLSCSIVFRSPHLVNGLMAGVTYQIQVYVITIKNISSPVMAMSATTVPRSPRNVIVKSYSDHSASISWDAPEDPRATQYLYWVSWFTENGSVPLGNGSTSGSNWTIDSLESGSLYLVKLASEIHRVRSADVSNWTLTSPCPPTNFRAEAINQTAVELAWMPPSSAVSAFKLQWKNSTESKGIRMFLNQSSRGVLLSGLSPSTNYTFTVWSVARRKNLITCSSGVEQEVATKPERISSLQCQVLQGGRSLKLSWTCPSHEITEVQVLVSDQPWVKWPGCNATVVIRKLQPFRHYRIRVKTSWYDQHEVSEPLECSTNSADIIAGLLFAGLLPLIILGLLLFLFWRQRWEDPGVRPPSQGMKKLHPGREGAQWRDLAQGSSKTWNRHWSGWAWKWISINSCGLARGGGGGGGKGRDQMLIPISVFHLQGETKECPGEAEIR
ncbi:Receptor-type tyrosine-protein phosphatase H [Varanus komodoensis]|nr:Receptor-type tyrosine-protein phosphatase H [Varanus komodoensis]